MYTLTWFALGIKNDKGNEQKFRTRKNGELEEQTSEMKIKHKVCNSLLP